MEFNFTIPGFQGREVSVWDAGALAHLDQLSFHKLRNVLEEFGQRSAAAQGLRVPITDIYRLRSSDQQLYLHTAPAAVTSSSCTVLGGLKIGRKKLFLHRVNGAIAEVEPLCVLDFYVHESYQRQGVGKALFEYMLAAEGQTPEQLGYDRPSPKLLAFLRKHYHLSSYVPQTNNFVVYEQYFQTHSNKSSSRSRESARQHINNASLAESPGSSSNSSCSAYNSGWRTVAPAGRQNVHVVGKAAAEPAGGSCPEQWVSASVRPPTACLKHSIQLNQSNVEAELFNSSISSPAVVLAAALGGPGCPAAGAPTYGGTDSKGTLTSQYQVLQNGTMCYARGAGVKNLQQGPAGSEGNTYRDFQQALFGAAAHPAPVLRAADCVQQQQLLQTGCGRDSLDDFQLNMSRTHNSDNVSSGSLSSSGAQEVGFTSGAGSRTICWPAATQNAANQKAQPGSVGQLYEVTAPFGSVQPPPLAVLTCAKSATMSRRTTQQQQQLNTSSSMPDHLLAAPSNSYAVPTAGMAAIINKHCQQPPPRQPGWAWQQQQHAANPPGLLAWDGLPPGRKQTAAESGLLCPAPSTWLQTCSNTERCQLDGGLLAATAADSGGAVPGQSRGSLGSSDSRLGTARAAAASHRAGSGAADCLKMF